MYSFFIQTVRVCGFLSINRSTLLITVFFSLSLKYETRILSQQSDLVNVSSPQPTQDTDDLSDEQIAKQLQMHEDMEVGRSPYSGSFIPLGITEETSRLVRLLTKNKSLFSIFCVFVNVFKSLWKVKSHYKYFCCSDQTFYY